MSIRPRTPSAGARAPIRPLRLVVALLAVLQLAAPLAAVTADPPPAAGHVDHVGARGDGCHVLHDELFCLSCRLMAAPLADSRSMPELSTLPGTLEAALAGDAAGLAAPVVAACHLPRAPPSDPDSQQQLR